MDEQLSPLSVNYVFGHIFKKLDDTVDEYSSIFPEIEELEKALNHSADPDFFQMTLAVIDVLKKHAEKSALVNEIFENLWQDFLHGLTPDEVPEHEGKYYINSVAHD